MHERITSVHSEHKTEVSNPPRNGRELLAYG